MMEQPHEELLQPLLQLRKQGGGETEESTKVGLTLELAKDTSWKVSVAKDEEDPPMNWSDQSWGGGRG
jgi:hypothetical protein